MSDDKMALLDLIEKRADADLVREMLAYAADQLMEAEVGGLTRAGYREKSAELRMAPLRAPASMARQSIICQIRSRLLQNIGHRPILPNVRAPGRRRLGHLAS